MDDRADGGSAPLFTVVIPTYDRAGVVVGAVESVLGQTVEDFELLVVDDGSTDDTVALLAGIADRRVRVLERRHAGVSAARNAGLAAASGVFVTFLDSDDRAEPGWLEGLASALQPPTPGLVRCAARIIDEATGDAWVAHPGTGPASYPYGVGLPGTYAASRTVLQHAGGFVSDLRFGENNELLIRVLAAASADGAPVRIVDRPLVNCHRRSRRSVEYGSAPAESSAYLLRHHRAVLAADRTLLADHLAIVGTGRLRAGRRLEAAGLFVRSLFARPSWRGIGRVALPLAPTALVERRADPGRTAVVVACPGAGRIHRGYETFAVELAEELQRFDDLDAHLLQGARPSRPWGRRIRHLDQDRRAARVLARLTRTHPKYVEHITFGLASIPRLLLLQPDVVVVSEHALASVLARARVVPGLAYSVVFNNGGLNRPPLSARFDIVQEVTPHARQGALELGESPDRHVLLPLALATSPEPPLDRRADRRRSLDLPLDQPLVVSVGRLDVSLKRMHHVVSAVAARPSPPFLVLLGQRHDETRALESLALRLLGRDGFRMATVEPAEVAAYYEAADLFVMAGASEGFGRVYIEALAAGLPCVVDDNPVTRYVCGPHGTYVDSADVDALSHAISTSLGVPITDDMRRDRWRWARDQFGWDALRGRYRDLLVGASGAR